MRAVHQDRLGQPGEGGRAGAKMILLPDGG
jgi:hypothetical protein